MATDRQGCNLIDRLQVLVLASPEIAEPICIALEDLAQVECTRPSTKPGAHGYNLKWLSSVLFSETVASEDDDDVSLFAWSRFDVVILQDLWLAEYEEGHTRLEFAGRVFASWDDSRGNFSTKKIVLVTDPELFQRRSIAWTKDWAVPVPQEEAQRVFDPKNSIEFIPLSNGGENSVARVVRTVTGRGRTETGTEPQRTERSPRKTPSVVVKEIQSIIRRDITSPVIKAAAPVIRKTVAKSSEIFLIEDEEEALRFAYQGLTGEVIPGSTSPVERSSINILTVSTGDRQPVVTHRELVKACKELIQPLLRKGGGAAGRRVHAGNKEERQDVVVVTDILFDLSNSTNTGIDLIRELRKSYPNQVGIVAFTGFKTPFVAMSAYLQGADYVVDKGEFGGSHDTLQLSGADRLLEALAFLCFQRALLRRMRKSCESLCAANGKPESKRIEDSQPLIWQFEKMMPCHTVSLHLQQEWRDTLYLFKLAQLQTDEDEDDFREEVRQFTAKYDHA
jgi:hypothetical protein